VTNEIFSQSRERIRHTIDWTVRAHPTVAAGIAGAAITVAGAYVALNAGNSSEDAVRSRPPAAVGAPSTAPPQGKVPQATVPSAPSARPEHGTEGGTPGREQAPRSGPGAAPDADRPPKIGAPHDSSAGGGSGGGGSSGSSGSSGGSGSGSGGSDGGGGSEPAPPPPPATQPPPAQPAPPPEQDCVVKVTLLGDLVKVCL